MRCTLPTCTSGTPVRVSACFALHGSLSLFVCLIVGVFACLIVCVFVRFMVCLIDCLFDCLCVVAAQNERHAAWEALFLQKTSATLHGSAPGGTPAAQNERHAAWEALFLKKTSATLHESAPGRPPGATRPPQDQDKTAH